MVETATAAGKYLYGIIGCAEPRVFAVRGIHELGPRVYTIPYGDLAAVVSDLPLEQYAGTRRQMMAHTRVLEAVMREFTVLPISFGVVAPDVATVRELLLCRRYDDLAAQLAEMHNRVELGLKAFWVTDDIFREIADQIPEIRSLRDSLQGRPAEATSYDRIRLGELVEAAANLRRQHDSAAILAELSPLAVATRTHPTITDRMVLNAAFLIERAREASFDQAIRDLDARTGQRLTFKYVGPVPPYSFVTIHVSWQ